MGFGAMSDAFTKASKRGVGMFWSTVLASHRIIQAHSPIKRATPRPFNIDAVYHASGRSVESVRRCVISPELYRTSRKFRKL